jgi:preprotein translocase subunit SecG
MQQLLTPILLAAHLLLAFGLIGIVLLQKSEGGLGGLGGGGGMGGFMTSRGTANLLTKTTRWLAAGFMATSLALAWLATHNGQPRSILEPTTSEAPLVPPPSEPQAPANTGTTPGQSSSPAQPAAPAGPAVPTTNQ